VVDPGATFPPGQRTISGTRVPPSHRPWYLPARQAERIPVHGRQDLLIWL